MNKYLVSYSTTFADKGYSDFELKQIRLIKSAEKFGIKNYKKWTRSSLKKEFFYKEYKKLLDIPKGSGLWIWKPYIILKALEEVSENDFIVYSDSSLYFINDPSVLFDLCKQNNGFFLIEMDSTWKLSMLCKRDIFHFLRIDDRIYHNSPLTEAYFMIFQKKNETIKFVKEWLSLCLNEKLITDENFSGLANLPEYKDNRGDMPLLSILRLQWKIQGYRNPSPWGNHLKLKEFRVDGEFLDNGSYLEDEIYRNSPYETILGYDKEGLNCSRPLTHFLSISFLLRKGRKFVSRS